jgi:hypothetical protein
MIYSTRTLGKQISLYKDTIMSISIIKFTTVASPKWGKGFFAGVEKTAPLTVTIEIEDVVSGETQKNIIFDGLIHFQPSNGSRTVFSATLEDCKLIKRNFLKLMSHLDSQEWNVAPVIKRVDEDEGSFFPTLYGFGTIKPYVTYQEVTIQKKQA